MCIHEYPNSKQFNALAAIMLARFNLVPLTLVINDQNFSTFVNPKESDCVQRAAHDLRTWHPYEIVNSIYSFSEQSADRIYGEHLSNWERLNKVRRIPGRVSPPSVDFDHRDPEAVYHACVANGYVDPAKNYIPQDAPDMTPLETEAAHAEQVTGETAEFMQEVDEITEMSPTKKHHFVMYVLEDEMGLPVGEPFASRETARAFERRDPWLKVGVYDLVRRPNRKEGGA
jgi:hypothetical protein